jgi:hypothetical protein
MTGFGDRAEIMRTVAGEHGVDPVLVQSLLDLEADHHNLHGYGARPALRRAAEEILDAAFAAQQPPPV